jgi:hypothetical protein
MKTISGNAFLAWAHFYKNEMAIHINSNRNSLTIQLL